MLQGEMLQGEMLQGEMSLGWNVIHPSNLQSQISSKNHDDRVRSLETGFSGLKDSINQHTNDFNSKMVSWWHFQEKCISSKITEKSFQNAMNSKMKTLISNVDHGDRITTIESGFTGLEDSMDQQRNNFISRLVNSLFNVF